MVEEILDNLQKQADELYEKFGAIDEVIELQVAINMLRNHFNIPDKTKMTDSNPGYTQ